MRVQSNNLSVDNEKSPNNNLGVRKEITPELMQDIVEPLSLQELYDDVTRNESTVGTTLSK